MDSTNHRGDDADRTANNESSCSGQTIKLRIVYKETEDIYNFELYELEKFDWIFKVFAYHIEVPVENICFMYEKMWVTMYDTPDAIGMDTSNVIEAYRLI